MTPKEAEYHRGWRERNAEKVREASRRWRAKNPNYTKDREATDLEFKLRRKLRIRLGHVVRGTWKSGSAVQDLGCSIEEFRSYLESKFQPGMTWDNYGKWHIDHILPLSKFDLTDRSQFLIACHYQNLQPLWAVQNLKKGDQVI